MIITAWLLIGLVFAIFNYFTVDEYVILDFFLLLCFGPALVIVILLIYILTFDLKRWKK